MKICNVWLKKLYKKIGKKRILPVFLPIFYQYYDLYIFGKESACILFLFANSFAYDCKFYKFYFCTALFYRFYPELADIYWFI